MKDANGLVDAFPTPERIELEHLRGRVAELVVLLDDMTEDRDRWLSQAMGMQAERDQARADLEAGRAAWRGYTQEIIERAQLQAHVAELERELAAERAAVVAYLRDRHRRWNTLAVAIERGAHRRGDRP